MRLLNASFALLAATSAALAAPVGARADTGGSRLYYVGETGMWTAPAGDAGHRSRVPRPHASDGAPVYPEQVVPSPNGSRIAITTHVRRSSGQRVYIAGPRGQHAVQVAAFDNDPDSGPNWTIDSINWQGEHRLYFSIYRGLDAPVIDTVRVPSHGTPGPVTEIPNSTGLYHLAVDPTSNRLAAVTTETGVCNATAGPLEHDIVVLNLESHQLRLLVPLTPPDHAPCAAAPSSLAWSPDGSRLAYRGLAHPRGSPTKFMLSVKTVLTGVHQSHQPQAVSPRTTRFYAGNVAWQSAHSLWFEARNDLYSIKFEHRQPTKPHRETHNRSALKFYTSFG